MACSMKRIFNPPKSESGALTRDFGPLIVGGPKITKATNRLDEDTGDARPAGLSEGKESVDARRAPRGSG